MDGHTCERMGIVIHFRPRKCPWHPIECRALASFQRVLDDLGMLSSFVQCVGEDQTPWRAFYNGVTGRLIANVVRTNNGYLLRWADGSVVHLEAPAQLVTAARSWTMKALASARSSQAAS